MKFFALVPLFAAFCNFPLALFVYTRNRASAINQVFLLWGLSLFLWNGGAFLMFRATSPEEAVKVARIVHLGVIFIPVSVIHLSLLIARVPIGKWIAAPYAIATALAASLLFTDFYFKGVQNVGYAYFVVAGTGFWIYSSIFPLMTVPALALVIRRRSQLNRWQRRKLTPLIIANALLLIFGAHDILPVLGIYKYPFTEISIYPWGTLMASVYGILVAYSVLQDELLDIRVSLGKTSAILVRLIFFSLISAILLLVAALLFPNQFTFLSLGISLVVIILGATISSFFFPKLLGTGSEALERRILGDRLEYSDKIRSFIDNFHQYRLIHPLLDDLNGLFADIVKVEWFQVTFFDSSTREISLQHTFPVAMANSLPSPNLDGPLLRLIQQRPKAAWLCFSDLPGTLAKNQEILANFTDSEPAFCFPFRSADDISGILIIGEKSDRSYYTVVDLELIGELCRHISILIDQIRLKRRAELTEQLESLSIMSRGLAHDLNNLVTPIHTYLQFAGARPQPDGDIADLLRIAVKNLDTIRAYVREAVFFSNTLAPKIDPIRVRDLLDGLATLCKHSLDKRNIGLCLDLPDPFDFHGDPILLQRLLSNLVFNAIDASPSGSVVTIRAVRLHRVPGHPAWIRLQVIDRGSGISAENLGRVFAPYFTTKNIGDQTRGFGLGLTICQKIVHLHRGTISINSAEGRGTTVQIDLPAEPAAAPAIRTS